MMEKMFGAKLQTWFHYMGNGFGGYGDQVGQDGKGGQVVGSKASRGLKVSEIVDQTSLLRFYPEIFEIQEQQK